MIETATCRNYRKLDNEIGNVKRNNMRRWYDTCLVWPGLVWSGLVWSGLVLSGLAWPGLAWPGLAWPSLAWPSLVVELVFSIVVTTFVLKLQPLAIFSSYTQALKNIYRMLITLCDET
uniref:Uncharacterized protein n=1 Tax=Vespula pensylvanica TaxID=30213 RepID=A0A834PAR6_VESPE|nr:hypothetical protein H0235_002833 [Vespula pensylvanica]